MTRLFLITVRWMKKDRKRTLLSFISVLLAVYMMAVLGIYFSSAVSMLRSKERYENGGYHVRFHCDNTQQAEKIAGNTAVQSSTYEFTADYKFLNDYLSSYAELSDGAEGYLPAFSINGKALSNIAELSPYFIDPQADKGSGNDAGQMLGNTGTDLQSGRYPQKEGEIVISKWLAEQYGLSVGSEVVLEFSIRKGDMVYAEYTVEKGTDENGIYCEKKKYLTADDKGAPAAVPDKDGRFLGVLNRKLEGFRSKKISTDTLSYTDLYDVTYQLFRACADEPLLKYAKDNNTFGEYRFRENNEERYIEGKIEGKGEVVKALRYRAKIVGLSGLYQAYFSVNDKAAKEFFEPRDGFSYVRIKEGYDVDDETEQIKKTVGLPDEYKDESGAANPTAELHDMLLFYEGRSLYDPNSSDPIIILGVFAVILAVFVFFARLIINNAFELSSAYRLSQYSSLKTVGVSNAQMFVMVMGECLLYLTAALPIALLLAFATGRVIISKITELKIFDALYGSGVTDRFFKLEISAPIMILIVTITVFSVVLSAYAVAIRMMKMPAVQARAADGTKPPRAVKRKWRTRKLFGFSAGYAIRSAFRKKMRFFITLLAAVVSATMVITIAALMFAVEKSGKKMYDADAIDFSVEIQSDFTGGSNISDDYKKLYDSGLFRIINTNTRFIDCFDKQGSWDKSFISDKLNRRYLGIRFASITQEKFKMLKSDISYDELVQKGGVLLCSKTYKLDDNSEKWVEDSDALKTVPDKITIQLISGKKESGDPETEDFSFDVSGTYTLKPNVNEYGCDSDIIAVVPMENYYKLFERLEFTDDESIMTKYTNLNITYPMKRLSVGLVAKDGKQDEADKFLKDTFKGRIDITSNIAQKQTLERSAKALRIAGMSLAAIVFAVAMMNIASTCAAEMVNRRRELSMLRAGGMSLRQIFKTVRIEVLLCSGVSTAISSLFGTLAASVIFKLIDENAKPAALPFSAMAAVFVLMYAVMLCAYLLPLKNMSRTSIAQDIRMKE
ncbi:MAG: ABC transporter permease [Ruminococcus sp.]|nr:ABC transporter permease [Ruminococcus sp.]